MTRPSSTVLLAHLIKVFGCLAAACLVGCGGPSRVEAPPINAASATDAAMEQYDSNGDGELDETELKACASIANAITEIDQNSDNILTKDELKARIEFIVQGRDGRCSLACRVVKGRSPVPGATVTFVPEDFMADMIQSASGKTNGGGQASIHIQDQMGGIQPGFYKVQITRPSSSGKETINKKYNEETVLGQEVTSGSKALSTGLIFSVK